MSGLELHLQSRFSFVGVQLPDRWLLKPEVVSGTASFFVFAKKKKKKKSVHVPAVN